MADAAETAAPRGPVGWQLPVSIVAFVVWMAFLAWLAFVA